MHIVIYGVISDDDRNDIAVDGPFYYGCAPEEEEAAQLARELANNPTKDVVIPRVMPAKESETIPDLMVRAQESWFKRFKDRAVAASHTIQRELETTLCPFQNASLDKILKLSGLTA